MDGESIALTDRPALILVYRQAQPVMAGEGPPSTPFVQAAS
jgi:hypothetical protein